MTISEYIHDALNWWVSGLLYLVPINLREKIYRTANRLIIDLNDASVNLTLYQGSSNELLQSRCLQKSNQLEMAALQDCLAELQNDDAECILLVPEDKVLVKTLTLPTSAKDNLSEILGFEMDRQTPFTVEQVYFDYQRLASSNNEKLQLELFVVTRNVVDELLAQLMDLQIHVQRVTIMRNGDLFYPLNLLPDHMQRRQNKSTNKLTQSLIAGCVLLFIVALYLPLSKQEKALEILEARVSVSRAHAKTLRALAVEREAILTRSRFLIHKQGERIAMIDAINDLTRILPDDTWLNRLVIRDNKIELQGESTTATAIIEAVENSTYFKDAQFRSPVTRNNATNKDKFNVSANMIIRGKS